ncbi:MAG TPA: hypothetical protein VMH87_08810 [Pseudomonadales bacterium]|nr:hypothetical protein [Pseudomonadales bacterium]
MKKCTHCGKEFPDDTSVCPNDGHAVIDPARPPASIPPPVLLKSGPQKSPDGRYLRYEDVPWYRREPGFLAMIGVLLCGFVTIALCLICLTGDVYKKRYDRNGKLEVWGIGNKIAAVVILIFQGFMLWLYHWLQNQ